ncbi:MAG TPA: LuxR C-terminal-related transcriptional regulator [Sporichthya sp.]|nr:LuxR C-terminal-related transcriptional regulator [Sporichthya sp.]
MREWPLVGRTEVLRSLREAVVDPGRRGLVLAGPAGVGKSRLAAEVLALAERAGLATARVTATKASSGIPLGALAPVLPAQQVEPGAVDDRADLLRRYAAALVERYGARRLVLLVDDAHHLDDISATLVHQLAESRQVLVLLTVRTGEPAPDAIVALWKDSLAERLELGGLTEAAIGEVLSWVLSGPVDEAAVADFARRSRGNVLFLRELVHGALDDGALAGDGGVWRLTGDLHPTDRLVELVEARLSGLAPEERELLEIVSFAEPVGPGELAALGSLEIAERLERRGLLASSRQQRRIVVTLGHPLYGEVLRAKVPALRARTIARSLAEQVEATGARRREDALRVATWRLVGGGAQPGAMLHAAELARWRYDFSLAEELASAAVAAGAGFEAEVLAAQLAALQGRSAEAADALAALAGRAETAGQRGRVALTRLDNRVIYAGTIDEGLRIAEEAEAALAGTPWEDEIASRRCALLVAREGPRAAAALAEPLLARATGEALVWACMPGSYSLARTGRIEAALDAARRGRATQAELPVPMDWYPWMHRFYEGEALAHAGRLRDAVALATEQYHAGVAESSIEAQAMFSWQLAKTVADRGHVDAAVRRAQMAIALYRQLDRPQFVEFCLIYLALGLSIGRRPAEAAQALAAHDGLGTVEPSFFMGTDLWHARGWAEVAAGNLPAGGDMFRSAAEIGERIGDLVGAATALHSLARIGHAKEVATRLTDLAAGIEGDLAAGRAVHARGLADRDPESLEAVSEAFDGLGADLLAAEAAADAAVAWRRRGDQRNGSAAERRAGWLASRCDGADTPALRGGEARARLTAAEWEAAQLAASGRSNKQIAEHLVVSVRTIENRLQHVYGKLGISSRAELATALEMMQRGREPEA